MGTSSCGQGAEDIRPAIGLCGPTSLIANDIVEIKTSICGPSGPMNQSNAAGQAVVAGPGLLERIREDRQRVGPSGFDRADQGVDELEIAADPVGPIEQHPHRGPTRIALRGPVGRGSLARQVRMIDPVLGWLPRRLVAEAGHEQVVGQEPQEPPQVLAPPACR